MTSAFKHRLATIAFVAASASTAASAAPVYNWSLVSGEANWTLSANGQLLLTAYDSVVRTYPTIPAVANIGQSGAIDNAIYTRTTGRLHLNLTQATGSGDALASIRSDNSFVDIKRSVYDEDGDNTFQYSVFMTDWNVDLATASVYATLYSRSVSSLGTSATRSLGTVALFTATTPGLTGGTQGQVVVDAVDAQGQATGHVSGAFQGELRMNSDAVKVILAGLQLADAPTANDLFRSFDWGTVNYSATLVGTPAVPEPSEIALVGGGLLALWAARRSGRQA